MTALRRRRQSAGLHQLLMGRVCPRNRCRQPESKV